MKFTLSIFALAASALASPIVERTPPPAGGAVSQTQCAAAGGKVQSIGGCTNIIPIIGGIICNLTTGDKELCCSDSTSFFDGSTNTGQSGGVNVIPINIFVTGGVLNGLQLLKCVNLL